MKSKFMRSWMPSDLSISTTLPAVCGCGCVCDFQPLITIVMVTVAEVGRVHVVEAHEIMDAQ